MRAAIYARISEDRDETQLGVARQITDCQALAAKRGWQIVDRYVDNDLSAYKAVKRPEWERLLADIAAGHVTAIVAYHLDRLTRQPRDLERFFDVCDRAGVRAMATVSGDIDLSTDDGRFHARIIGAVARKSSDDQSRRLRRKALELAQAGRPTGGGTRPFGFDADRVTIRPGEAQIIRELVDRFVGGESLRGLCADLNARHVHTPTGREWAPQVLRRLLASARISGQREHHGEIIGPAAWEAIVTPEQTARVRAILADPSRRATRAARAYPLKGVLRCAECSALLVSRPREDGQRRYVCASGPRYVGCGKTYVLAEPVELFIAEAVFDRLDTPELGRAILGQRRQATDASEHQREADRVAGRLDELAQAYAAGQVSMREWLAARDPLQSQLDDARRRVARDSNVSALADHVGRGGRLRERWPSMTADQQSAVLRAILVEVRVGRAVRGRNRFQPERFQIVWRH